MSRFSDCLTDVSVSDFQQFRNIAVLPIVSSSPQRADYMLLDAAMGEDLVEIDEVDESGEVGRLSCKNNASKPVFLLDGEELLGAKQNRILNVSVLVPARTTLTIPVSCVEAGRWHRESSVFRNAGRTHHRRGRAQKMEAVNFSLQDNGERRGDQSAIWEENDRVLTAFKAVSESSATDEVYAVANEGLAAYEKNLSVVDDQVGALFAINGEFAGLELFDSHESFKQIFPKFVSSYSLDALELMRDWQPESQQLESDSCAALAKELAKSLSACDESVYPAVGIGEDVRIQSEEIVGGALYAFDRIVQFSAFPRDGDDPNSDIEDDRDYMRLSRSSLRRTN